MIRNEDKVNSNNITMVIYIPYFFTDKHPLGKEKHCCPVMLKPVSHLTLIIVHVPYNAKFWWGKTLANRLFLSFGEENVGEFTIANVSYFNESGIWLGKNTEPSDQDY